VFADWCFGDYLEIRAPAISSNMTRMTRMILQKIVETGQTWQECYLKTEDDRPSVPVHHPQIKGHEGGILLQPRPSSVESISPNTNMKIIKSQVAKNGSITQR
jgi:hypothetical protein